MMAQINQVDMKHIPFKVIYRPFLLLITALWLCACVYGQQEKPVATKILFDGGASWEATLQKAAAAHKYIFVDAYASWCVPCKLLKATTFRNREVARFFNQHFVNLSLDMEKGEGETLSAKWEVQSYPTLIIFDATGKPVLETIGFLKPAELLRFARQALGKEEK